MPQRINPYDDPAHYGLEIVGDISWDSDPYQFNYTVIWRNIQTAQMFYASDSGCSCPSPFERLEVGSEGWNPLILQEFIDAMAKRLSEMERDDDYGAKEKFMRAAAAVGEVVQRVRMAGQVKAGDRLRPLEGKPEPEPEPKPEPLPKETLVSYEGELYRVTDYDQPEEHPLPPPGDYDLAEIYPDGVAYVLWPEGVARKMGNRFQTRIWVRRTSLTVVEE